MFNVSALLLDDAFNPAMPLSNCTINEMQRYDAFTRHKVSSSGGFKPGPGGTAPQFCFSLRSPVS